MLNAALREVLGPEIKQKGSNITRERLRFDFSFHRKLTEPEKKEVEEIVNNQIKKGMPIKSEVMSLEQAQKTGAAAEFEDRYPDEVFVYSIGDLSKEICFGPHVANTNELGVFKIKREQNIGSGLRRIKAVLQ